MKNVDSEATITFSVIKNDELKYEEILSYVYNAMYEKGYDDPEINMCGFFISGDPAYITNFKNARSKICGVDRYELLSYIIKKHFKA